MKTISIEIPLVLAHGFREVIAKKRDDLASLASHLEQAIELITDELQDGYTGIPCSVCGRDFGLLECADDEGERYCRACYLEALEDAKASEPESVAEQVDQGNTEDPNRPSYDDAAEAEFIETAVPDVRSSVAVVTPIDEGFDSTTLGAVSGNRGPGATPVTPESVPVASALASAMQNRWGCPRPAVGEWKASYTVDQLCQMLDRFSVNVMPARVADIVGLPLMPVANWKTQNAEFIGWVFMLRRDHPDRFDMFMNDFRLQQSSRKGAR